MENMDFFQYFANKCVLTHSSAMGLGINTYQRVILMAQSFLINICREFWTIYHNRYAI